MKVKFKRLHPLAIIPKYMTAGSVGMDLAAVTKHKIPLGPRMRCLVRTGLAIEIPEGYEGQIRPRSGLAIKHGITIINAPGTIDSDYRGEIKIGLINLGEFLFSIEQGMRIAQLVIVPVVQAEIIEVDDLSDTDRGGGGFGHTG